MIADDWPTIRKLVEIVLCRQGDDVIALPDGVTARRSLVATEKDARKGCLSIAFLLVPLRMGIFRAFWASPG